MGNGNSLKFMIYLCISMLVLSSSAPVLHMSGSNATLEDPSYCLNSVRSDFRRAFMDEFGVPVTEYGYVAGVYIGPQRYPITIGHQALRNFDIYSETNASYASFAFLQNADWLASHAQKYGDFSVFEHRFPLYYGSVTVEPPWRSAMAQGLAIEALTKAYGLTGNKTYIESAKDLLNAFYASVSEGGVTHKTRDHGWWYDLVASGQGVNPKILNGHLYALLGIYEYYNTTREYSAKFLFDQGITALRDNLARFDSENGTYSYYDLTSPRKFPSQDYHRLIVSQLAELFEITSEPIIEKYYEKWRNFELPPEKYESAKCLRTVHPPIPVFRPADYGIRIGPTDIATNESHGNLSYSLDFPGFRVDGLNFTSQILNYPARNITFLPMNSEEIVFTVNIEGIHQPNIKIRAIFGSPSEENGWNNDNLFVINAGSNKSVTVHPSEIVGKEYLQVRDVNVFLPERSISNRSTFGLTIG